MKLGFTFKLILSLLLLSGYFYGKDLEKISLQLQWKHQFQFAGYYIAKEKGFYKDAGLDVEIKEHKYNLNTTEEVVNGRSQYGIGRSSLIIDRANHKDIVILLAVLKTSPIAFFSLQSSGIDTIEKFIGKKVMLNQKETATVSLQAMLNSHNVTFNQLILMARSYNIEDLINKKTDIMPGYTSDKEYDLEKRGIKYNVFSPKDYGFDFYEDILFTTGNELKNHPERVEALRNASLKGWQYAFEHIDEAVDLILKKYNTQKKTREALLYEAKRLRELAFHDNSKLGEIDVNKIQRTYDIYNLMGFVKEKINLGDFIYKMPAKYSVQLNTAEKQFLKEKKQITMCIDPLWMPYESFSNGEHIGMTADYYKIMSRTLGIPIVPVETKTWSESLEYAKSRKCDILSLAMETPSRKVYMDFTKPYLQIPLVIATKPGVPFITNFKSIDHTKKIAIPKGYAFNELIKQKYPNLNIIDVKNIQEGLTKVSEGDLYGYIGSLSSVGYMFQQEFTGELQIAGKFDEKWELGIGVRNDEPLLLSIMEKTIKPRPFF